MCTNLYAKKGFVTKLKNGTRIKRILENKIFSQTEYTENFILTCNVVEFMSNESISCIILQRNVHLMPAGIKCNAI